MRLRATLAGLAVLGVACHRGPKQPARLSITIEPGFLQFSKLGDRQPLAAKAQDMARKPVADAQFAWRSSDTSVALVKDGQVVALKDGIARIWAVSGVDSSFAVAVVQVPHLVNLTLQPALAHFESLGDTTTLVVNNPDSLVTPRAECMADDPHIAVVDSSYRVHTVGNGTTLIRCRTGEAEASMRVTVTQRIARVGIVTGLTRTMRMERDTIHLGLAKVDKRNTPVDAGTPRWASLDTNVVTVDPSSGAAIGKAEGTARVVGIVNGLADTTELQVIPRDPVYAATRPSIRAGATLSARGARGVPGGGGVRGVPNLGPRPQSTVVGVRDILASDSVFQAGALSTVGQESPLHVSLMVVSADHAVDEGLGLIETSGLMFGGEVEYAPSSTFSIRFNGASGPSLAAANPSSKDETILEYNLDMGLTLFPAVQLKLGGGVRGIQTSNPSFTQRWLTMRAGAEVHYDIGGVALGTVSITGMPIVKGTPDFAEGSPWGLAATAGISYHPGRLAVGASYELERYFFPGNGRREQFGELKFRLGLNLGGH